VRVAIIGARGIPARYSGWETVATELAPRLVARGCDVTVYCQRRYSLPDRPSTYDGVRLVYLPAIQRQALENTSHQAISLAHALRCRYDVIYVLGMRATPLYAVARGARATIFFNTDGHDWKRRKWGPKARRYLQWNERTGVRINPDGLIADSQAIAEYFVNRYRVTPTFIPHGAPAVDPPGTATILARGLDAGQYFLSVCRIEPENNVDKTIAAYAGLVTDKKLVIVGDTNYRSSYFEDIQRSAPPGVLFTGRIFEPDELNALFCHSFAYIHGHEVGGTNPSLLHAMAAGCAVFANDVPYNREALGDTGGYWASTDALRRLMQAALDAPESIGRFPEAARKRVAEYYDWEDIADQYLALFAKRLASRPVRVR